VLVIGSESLSKITDWNDRATAPLFGDGAGAVVLESVDGPGQLLGWDIDADGSALSILNAEVGGFINMEGKEVFRRAIRIMVDSAQKSLDHAGITADEIDLIVPHQANVRIIDAACERLGIPMDRAAVVLDRTGNTSSASIPIALADALDSGRVKDDDLLLLVGFGGGMTAGSCVLRWGGGLHE
jgi:3-oxoacyl-[acyl-carrier-protein] synthase-3